MDPSNQLFYGLPNSIWDDLCAKAEDLLHEKGIGQHVLGLYSMGPRMYGLEYAAPEILCVYLDTPEKFLNPLLRGTVQDRQPYFTVTPGGNTIHFMDIYEWIQKIYLESFNRKDRFFDVVPVGAPAFYVDDNMLGITSLINDYFTSCKYASFLKTGFIPYKERILQTRTSYIMSQTGIYSPCINLDWDNVISLPSVPKKIRDLDKQLCSQILNNESMLSPNECEYITYLDNRVLHTAENVSYVDEAPLKEAAKIVEEMYRFQL